MREPETEPKPETETASIALPWHLRAALPRPSLSSPKSFAGGELTSYVWAGGTLDGVDDPPCVIECVAGQSQGVGGTYAYICKGADLTEPAPACARERRALSQ